MKTRKRLLLWSCLCFAAAFVLESAVRSGFLFVDQPNTGNPALYIIRLVSYLLILAANVRKSRA